MTVDWSKIYKNYKGKWVALKEPDDKEVLASGETLKEILKKAKKKGHKSPVVMQVPDKLIPIVGSK